MKFSKEIVPLKINFDDTFNPEYFNEIKRLVLSSIVCLDFYIRSNYTVMVSFRFDFEESVLFYVK